jgi:hypothetical protein
MYKYLNALLVAVYSSSAFAQMPPHPNNASVNQKVLAALFSWILIAVESSCSATTKQGHLTYINHWVYCLKRYLP